jgi:multifunctional methyltransferase subunit TRM112
LDIEDMEVSETEFNEGFMARTVPQLNWPGVLLVAAAVGFEGLPAELDADSVKSDRDFLLALHKLLLDVHILKGTLRCPESGREFKIEDGIANMNTPEEDAS